jgi:hypothetical protein
MPNVPFWLAKQYYARLRRQAFASVVRDAVLSGAIREPVHLTQTDDETVAAWRATWRGSHPSGFGNWDWERILRRAWRRPSAFHVAVWSGDRLCGLGVGRLSKRRPLGVRHTLSLHFIESAHDDHHPLRGSIAALVIAAADSYGRLAGASRLRLMEPLPGVVRYYEDFGFAVARKAGQPVYCERRILP